jgi:hydrogenase maturation protease
MEAKGGGDASPLLLLLMKDLNFEQANVTIPTVEPEVTEKKFITILGLGNILLQDEGFGVHFAQWFSERYRLPEQVNVIDGGTLGYVLLDTLSRCEHLIVIDVIKLKDLPGSLYRFTQEEMEIHMPPPTSAHEVKFADVICKAELMGELPEMTFLCIVPEKYGDLDMELTSAVKEKFPDMEKLLLKELSVHGITPERAGHA